jgi:hypothetical protein
MSFQTCTVAALFAVVSLAALSHPAEAYGQSATHSVATAIPAQPARGIVDQLPDPNAARQAATREVESIFVSITGRYPGIRDTRLYVDAILYDGYSTSQIRREIAQDFGPQVLERIYVDVLGRYPDFSGMDTYIRALSEGRSQIWVRRDVANSGEAREALNRIYQQLLFRDIDPSGYQTYKTQLANGRSLDWVRNEIRKSDEYRSKN